MKWLVSTEVDPQTGDTIIPIPPAILDQLQWCEGDHLELIEQLDYIILRKIQ